MSVTIALAGNPNSGKTTLFNEMTGASQYVGNWPGVTVEKKEGKLRGHSDVTIVDLPGIYSLSPYTLEEVITRNYIINEKPDVIINVVDSSNIERNLYLTTQLIETRIPVVIALNMIDVVKKSGNSIDSQKLSSLLGCAVVETSAVKGDGLHGVAEAAINAAQTTSCSTENKIFNPNIEEKLQLINNIIKTDYSVPNCLQRWYSIKLFERDKNVLTDLHLSAENLSQIEAITSQYERDVDDDSESIITNERYSYIEKLIKDCVKISTTGMTTSDKIDVVITNRLLALPIFAAVMTLVYYVSVSWLGTIVTDWTNDTLFAETIQPAVTGILESAGAAEWLIGLIVDGCIGGMGAVLGFVPQMFILFFFLSVLEDCGYMARVAFIMDRIFRKFGLSGKSFIPMLISSGCGVPGIMASRTIENEKDRRMTVIVTTFIPCGAKLPIVALIGGALFPDNAFVAPAMYFLGVAAVIVSGIILKKTQLFAGDPAPFIMELPQYHIPGAKSVFIHMWERGKSFVLKAGSIIFVACGVIWFLSSFGYAPDGTFGMVDEDISLLAALGNLLAPLFAPIGFGNWRAAVATVSGLVAKENVVGTFGVLFGLGEVAEDDPTLLTQIATMFSAVTAMSFMVFNLLCAPCFAAIGAVRRELGWAWTIIAIGYQTLLAYAVAFIVNQLGSLLIMGVSFKLETGIAVLLLIVLIWALFRSPASENKERVSSSIS